MIYATDALLNAMTEALSQIRDEIGWREALRQLKRATQDQTALSIYRDTAVMLLNDYNHLVENGLSPYLAMHTLLMEIEQ
jgi:hypothetical protein